MVSQVYSLGCLGLDAYDVNIEVDIQRGLPAVSLVGLVDMAVRESKDRIRSAIKNSGFNFPVERITINLAPAHIKKEGTHFDLAIALGVIAASQQANLNLKSYYIGGELSLEGKTREIKGIFPMAIKAKEEGKTIILPLGNAREAALVRGLKIIPVESLREAVSFIEGLINIEAYTLDWKNISDAKQHYPIDFSDVRGQIFAKRAIETAISGMHNILLIGAPGVGKTMLARRLPTILPEMEFEETLEVTKIYSIAGFLDKDIPLVRERPFRSPHHTSSSISLVGGGVNIKPGEITLSHHGVLFLDELPEFSRDALEALRQPLEDGYVNISRASRRLKFPAQFILVGAMNPCPCGYFNSRDKSCHCTSYQIKKYRNKISGPLLDRIDVHIELAGVKTDDLLSGDCNEESSAGIKDRIEKVRLIQKERFYDEGIFFNSQMNHRQIRKYCSLENEAKNILKMAMKQFSFSARAYDKVLKVSRTITDMAERTNISAEDISEAIQYRSLDKNLWV